MVWSEPGRVTAALQRIITPGCLQKFTHDNASAVGLRTPIYVAHARRLRRRRQHIAAQLTRVGAADVTFVLCADADAIATLDPATYHSLHPQYTRTHWSPATRTRLPNGTLSLALKHRIAHYEIWRRGFDSALVIEDDAVLSPSLPAALAQYVAILPRDASLFFVGSYSRSRNPRLTLAEMPPVAASSSSSGEALALHRRLSGTTAARPPYILGTVAYLVTYRGALHLGRLPVRAEADVDLSLLSPTHQCGAPLVEQCAVGAPPGQYGPSQWLVWQDEAIGKEITHGSSKSSVHDGWRRSCREAKPTDEKLRKACRRFGFAIKGQYQ